MEKDRPPTVRLDLFDNGNFVRGRSVLTEALWLLVFSPLMSSQLPGSVWRIALLRIFGAKVGRAVIVKPRVIVKFPWRLEIGDHTWIGEGVWIDNLAVVSIGAHACISQGVYLCTGSHDWSLSTFDLITKPIQVGDSAWVCAKAVVAPGVSIGVGAVAGMGAVVACDITPWTVLRADGSITARPIPEPKPSGLRKS
jgi:putative colanic acid biosynthesis acetyltransferase WcaF